MKKILLLTIITISFISCKKDDEPEPQDCTNNCIAVHLMNIIETEGIQALQTCCYGCNCGQTIGYGTDYEFIGDNFLRFVARYYNLEELQGYAIKTSGSPPETEKRLVLYF